MYLPTTVLLLFHIYVTTADEEKIYSTKEGFHIWKPYHNSDAKENGWHHKSSKDHFGVYNSCSLIGSHYLFSDLISVDVQEGDVRALNVYLEMEVAPCKRECSTNVELYLYGLTEDQAALVDSDIPSVISGLSKPIQLSSLPYVASIYLKSKVKGIYIVLLDNKRCVQLSGVSVYSVFCAPKTENFAIYSKTYSQKESVLVHPQCISYAMSQPALSDYCLKTGLWYSKNTDQCQCIEGYYNNTRHQCESCPVDFYKAHFGNYMCHGCPAHSFTDGQIGQSICGCENGYFRAKTEQAGLPCGTPPSPPRNAAYEVDFTKVVITWDPPKDFGLRSEVWYSINCSRCFNSRERPIFSKDWHRLSNTRVVIGRLAPYTEYDITIRAHNVLSFEADAKDELSFRRSITDIRFTTEGNIMINVEDIKVEIFEGNIVNISWKSPLDTKFPRYTIQTEGNLLEEEKCVLSNKFSFKDAKTGTYSFKVAIGCGINKGAFSKPKYIKLEDTNAAPLQKAGVTLSNQFYFIAISVSVILIAVFIILICALVMLKRVQQNTGQYPDTALSELTDYECARSYQTVSDNQNFLSLPRPFTEPGSRSNEIVFQYIKNIDSNHLKGSFLPGSRTCDGFYQINDDRSSSVSLKLLPVDADEKIRAKFFEEAAIMCQLKQKNVLKLYGMCLKTKPNILVIERAENGRLSNFFRQENNNLTYVHRMRMLREIATGMEFFSIKFYVHKVLCSRTVFVTGPGICKIGGFDLRVKFDADLRAGNSSILRDLLPWSAPEAYSELHHTVFSDVWAFGVVMWEVLTNGCEPFKGLSYASLAATVAAGLTVAIPDIIQASLKKLLNECWQKDPMARPNFSHIITQINNAIMSTSRTTRQYSYSPVESYESSYRSNPSSVIPLTISDWLIRNDFEKFQTLFERAEINQVEQLFMAEDSVLKSIGISSRKDRRKMLNSIELIKHACNQPFEDDSLDTSRAFSLA